jgi:hypothetical protein
VGRGLDGLARGVLFAVTFGLGASLAVAAAGSGALVAAFILFLLAGIGVYAMSAVEAYGLAQGGGLLVETKVLMWALVGRRVRRCGPAGVRRRQRGPPVALR